MSKYTTQVRFLCETEAGLNESSGYNDVNSILEKAVPNIFNFNYPIFDENYRFTLNSKILKHYYTREIAFETAGLWRLKLDTRMNEIMPYYNKFYSSELLDFNPLYDVDLTRDFTRTNEGTQEMDGSTTRKEDGTSSSKNTVHEAHDINESLNQGNTIERIERHSDTPQGDIDGLLDTDYLTSATIINEDNDLNNRRLNETTIDTTNNADLTNVINDNSTVASSTDIKNLEEYIEHIKGKSTGKSFVSMLTEFRNSFINIDMMVIEELSDLFFNLW